MTQPRIAVLGLSGQLAQALVRAGAARGLEVVAAGRPQIDVLSVDSVGRFLFETRPTLAVNAVAYTAVDKAESDAEEAFRINAGAPALIATLCAHFAVPLLHISTDYVFDGSKGRPYVETDPIVPLGVYGASKAAGEAAVRTANARHLILRTSWLYSETGTNFARTMLRLARERDVVRVVADQMGAPTSANDVAGAILDIAGAISARGEATPWGTYHLAAGGETSWHGFAEEIFRLAAARGHSVPRLEAITTAEYPTPARRPAYSVLDSARIGRELGISMPHWRTALARDFDRILDRQPGASA